jgi:hypothetical protein
MRPELDLECHDGIKMYGEAIISSDCGYFRAGEHLPRSASSTTMSPNLSSAPDSSRLQNWLDEL